MKLKVIVHEAEEGGYWAEVPALPGCVTQGETFEELLQNLYEAIEGWFDVEDDVSSFHPNRNCVCPTWSTSPRRTGAGWVMRTPLR